jgi:2,5-diamino-6-(ribosylamino)-4(3H)-pyrimidinone 5'-phosphate reductase
MKPKVTIYNEISLDGYVTGIQGNMELYYGISSQWGNDAVIVGSETVIKAIPEVPKEKESDRKPSPRMEDETLPYLALVDSKGRVRSHHIFRQQPYIREVIVLISRSTPDEYRNYLKEREYPMIETGEDHVDIGEALEVLNERFHVKNIRNDSGGTLNAVLMNEGLVDRVVALIDPIIVGRGHTPFFERLEIPFKLELESIDKIESGEVLISYSINEK